MEWRPVVGYEKYLEVSNTGQLRSVDRFAVGRWGNLLPVHSKILKQSINKCGYMFVSVKLDGSSKNIKTSRAVAEAFIPNPMNKPQVDHIDGNKQNNCVENLRWVTAKENIAYAEQLGLRENGHKKAREMMQDPTYKANLMNARDKSKRKPTYCYNMDGSFVDEYESCTAAAISNDVGRTYVSQCCTGRLFSVKGKRYSYVKMDTLPGGDKWSQTSL